jgi:two-component system LytT family response regulator
MKIRTILIDDESHSILLFKQLLSHFKNNCEVVASADNLKGGIALIEELKPDVVFLDVEMPNHSGLEIGEFLDGKFDFKLIYLTAHSEYAINAWRLQAFDYLLKPLKIEELKSCLEKVTEAKIAEKAALVSQSRKIVINTQEGISYIDLDDVFYLKASAMYATLYSAEGEIVISKPLRDFDYLCNAHFFRTHRSYIVNTEKIKSFNTRFGATLELIDGTQIPIANSNRERLKTFMKNKYGLL